MTTLFRSSRRAEAFAFAWRRVPTVRRRCGTRRRGDRAARRAHPAAARAGGRRRGRHPRGRLRRRPARAADGRGGHRAHREHGRPRPAGPHPRQARASPRRRRLCRGAPRGHRGHGRRSQNALPGEALYPIKRGIEKAEVRLSIELGRPGPRPARPGRRPARRGPGPHRRGLRDRDSRGRPTRSRRSPRQAQEGSDLLLSSYADSRDPATVTSVREFAAVLARPDRGDGRDGAARGPRRPPRRGPALRAIDAPRDPALRLLRRPAGPGDAEGLPGLGRGRPGHASLRGRPARQQPPGRRRQAGRPPMPAPAPRRLEERVEAATGRARTPSPSVPAAPKAPAPADDARLPRLTVSPVPTPGALDHRRRQPADDHRRARRHGGDDPSRRRHRRPAPVARARRRSTGRSPARAGRRDGQ